MQFEKDIFISYAHIDDEALIEDQKGWITDFHRALDIRLAQMLGRKPVIWRDPKLQGNHLFDKQITDQFADVAVMICILSPRYVRSEWCLRELNEFYQVCQKNIGIAISNKVRIFKVVKTPVPADLSPEKIRNLLGYEFFGIDTNTGRFKEYSRTFGREIEWMYWEKLNDLVHDISSFLQELEDIKKGGSLVNSKPDPAGAMADVKQQHANAKDKDARKIFLAESTYDIQSFRDNIKRELQDNGYQVYPDRHTSAAGSLVNGRCQAIHAKH
jgi:hypothetical protein